MGDRPCLGPLPQAPSKGILGLLLPLCWWDGVVVGGREATVVGMHIQPQGQRKMGGALWLP